jgi:nucleoside-diphosphate-sugar epimerase
MDLLSEKHEVIATSTNQKQALGKKWYQQVQYVEHKIQLTANENLFNKFNEPDVVIHLAWSGLPNYNSLIHIEQNLLSHYFFLKNLVQHGLKNIAVAGTCFEYGLKEGSLSEDMETNPVNAYGLSKDCLRKMLQQLGMHLDYNLTWMRIFYPYGKGQYQHSLIPLLESAIENNLPYFNMSKGDQVRDFIKVELMSNYIVNLSTNHRNNGIVNICSGNGITVSTNEPMSFWGDTKKLLKIINS